MEETTNIKQLIGERIASLPAPVRNAIESAELEQHLRGLAEKHKLHFDQWDSLEQEVMLTLLGVHPIEELEINMVSEVGISLDLARTLATDINSMIFEPIRQELERQLEHPEAREKEVSGVEAARQQQLQTSTVAEPAPTAVPMTSPPATTTLAPTPPTPPAPAPVAPAVTPATPPSPVPDVKVTRPSESTAYRPGEASHERKSVTDDPYREPVA
jgi:hypothetical protein